MLEIAAIIFLCRSNKKHAIQRGRKPGGFVALTAVLWVGMEILGIIIGFMMGMEEGAYLLAIIFAGIGALSSHLIAKNCRIGDYVSPTDQAIADIVNNPEVLETPATIDIVRDKSFVGCLADYPVTLNGQRLASLRNGYVITVPTSSKYNVLQISDKYGTEGKPFMFEMESGGHAEIHFKAGNLQPMAVMGALPAMANAFKSSNVNYR